MGAMTDAVAVNGTATLSSTTSRARKLFTFRSIRPQRLAG